jgi:hypothetical protein
MNGVLPRTLLHAHFQCRLLPVMAMPFKQGELMIVEADLFDGMQTISYSELFRGGVIKKQPGQQPANTEQQ